MADYKNIPLGLRTQTQIPLDVKEYIQNESLLSNLGVNGQLAYTYTKGLVVYCIEESTRWEWTEVKPGLEDTGLINQDFIYSDNHIAFGIDYSNKRYNFVKVASGSETKINAGTNTTVTGNGTDATPYIINSSGGVTVNDATSSIKGILRLTGDLGGTADAPTTPTAVHKTGTEIITGTKIISSTVGTPCNLQLSNSSSVNPLLITQAGNSAAAISIVNSSTLSDGYYIECGTVSTGFPLIIKNNTATSFTINKLGEATGTKFIKSGGTSSQYLMADGSVKENQDNLQKVVTSNVTLSNVDNDYTIFINNGATPITITIDSSITTSNFCVGFIQEGTGDVTFVGSGVSLTNPVGLKSKGQGYQTFIERKLATSNFYLLGNTRA